MYQTCITDLNQDAQGWEGVHEWEEGGEENIQPYNEMDGVNYFPHWGDDEQEVQQPDNNAFIRERRSMDCLLGLVWKLVDLNSELKTPRYYLSYN